MAATVILSKGRYMRHQISLVLLVISLSVMERAALGDEPFEPIPAADQSLYKFDFAKWFYADDAARQRDKDELAALTGEAQLLRESGIRSADSLLSAIKLRERMGTIADRLQAYGGLRFAVNTEQTELDAEGIKAYDDFLASTAFVQDATRALSDDQVAAFLNENRELNAYRHLLARWRRSSKFIATPEQEQLLIKFDRYLDPFTAQFYATQLAQTEKAVIEHGGMSYRVTNANDYRELMRLSDREIRKQAFLKRLETFKAHSDPFAYALFRKIQSANDVASLRKFPNAIDATLYNVYLQPSTVDAVLTGFRDNASLAIRFQAAEYQLQQKLLQVDKIAPWDLDATAAGSVAPRFAIASATKAVQDSTKLFGDDYARELNHLVDPRNGRLDIVSGANRQSGDFTWGSYGPSWVFFMNGYRGQVTDVVTFSHECAHGVHFRLLFEAKVPWHYADGERYFTEGFAKINELLLLKHLAKNAQNAQERLYYLRELNSKLASVKFASMYWAAYATSFEVEIYRRAAAGKLTEPDQIHEVWAELGRQWSHRFDEYPDQKYTWAGTHHFFDEPRRYSNYLFAWVIAIAMIEKFDADPTASEKLVKLMKTGFSDEPNVLLKRELGLDLADPQIVTRMFQYVDRNVKEFEEEVKALK